MSINSTLDLVFSFQKRYMRESIDKIPSDGILTLILDQSVSFLTRRGFTHKSKLSSDYIYNALGT